MSVGIVSPPTYWRTVTIFALCRSRSAIKMSVAPWSIHMYSSVAAKRSAALWTHG